MMPRRDPRWLAESACKQHPEVDFFPPKGTSARQAVAVCIRCSVRPVCLEYALAQHEFGIWGGTTERARAQMRRVARRARTAPPEVSVRGATRASMPLTHRAHGELGRVVAAAS